MNDKYGWEYFKSIAANNPKIGRSVNDTVTESSAASEWSAPVPTIIHSNAKQAATHRHRLSG